MSKSLGNSPDPLDVIAEYGADALRFTVVYLAPLGQDVLFSTQKCELGRNFANKLWNAGRFLLMYKQRLEEAGAWTAAGDGVTSGGMGIEDRWIFSRYHATIRDLQDGMDRFRVNDMAKTLYDFIWHDFCDWYIELIKDRLYSDDTAVQLQTLRRALHIYDGILRLLHPVMPFITEELWHKLDDSRAGSSIMTQKHPEFAGSMIDEVADNEMNFLQSMVEGVRTILGEMNVPAGKSCDVHIACGSDWQLAAVTANTHFLRRLARINEVHAGMDVKRPRLSASAVIAGAEVFVPLEGLIDIELERKRLEKEIARVTGLVNGIDSKLGNAKFLSNAPEDVVAREHEKQAAFRLNLEKLHANLHSLDQD
jgi:valyl-tRNA synthetase